MRNGWPSSPHPRRWPMAASRRSIWWSGGRWPRFYDRKSGQLAERCRSAVSTAAWAWSASPSAWSCCPTCPAACAPATARARATRFSRAGEFSLLLTLPSTRRADHPNPAAAFGRCSSGRLQRRRYRGDRAGRGRSMARVAGLYDAKGSATAVFRARGYAVARFTMPWLRWSSMRLLAFGLFPLVGWICAAAIAASLPRVGRWWRLLALGARRHGRMRPALMPGLAPQRPGPDRQHPDGRRLAWGPMGSSLRFSPWGRGALQHWPSWWPPAWAPSPFLVRPSAPSACAYFAQSLRRT